LWKGLILDQNDGLKVLASDSPSSIWKNFNDFRKIKELINPSKPSFRMKLHTAKEL